MDMNGVTNFETDVEPVAISQRLFTPNVFKGDDSVRYVLFIHSECVSKAGTVLLSSTADGIKFEAAYLRDRCGLGCFCSAHVTPLSVEGVELLAGAKQIDTSTKADFDTDNAILAKRGII